MENDVKYLKFDVEVNTWVTRESDPDDQWDNDSTDGTVTVSACHLVERDEYKALPCSFPAKPGDTIYLVWAQYSTGDSFGSYGAQYELCAVFNNPDEAEKEKDRLENTSDYSVPWTGYFESLDSLNVESFVVQ
jgi:hypothetical protein